MIIDTHLHEDRYSHDSKQRLEDIVKVAKKNGLDAICVTDHDNNYLAREFDWYFEMDGIIVIVGNEVYTKEGDILYFGKKDIPNRRIPFDELYEMTKDENRAFIAAHPYRNNMRGVREKIDDIYMRISAIEVFNGNTPLDENIIALNKAIELDMPMTGGADSHNLSRVGVYATEFYDEINSYDDFIDALNSGNFEPLQLSPTGYRSLYNMQNAR